MATSKKKAPKKAAPAAKKAVAAKKAPATKAPAKKAPAKKAAPAKAAPPAATPAPVKRSTKVNAYLTFSGNCEEAFKLYKSVFGGKFGAVMKFKDAPPMEGQPPLSAEDGNKIMHISLPISSETVLMGSDTTGAYGASTVVGTNFSLSASAASKPGADKMFKGLSEGGKVVLPMANQFWGSYFGMLVDRFGIQWMVSFDKNPM